MQRKLHTQAYSEDEDTLQTSKTKGHRNYNTSAAQRGCLVDVNRSATSQSDGRGVPPSIRLSALPRRCQSLLRFFVLSLSLLLDVFCTSNHCLIHRFPIEQATVSFLSLWSPTATQEDGTRRHCLSSHNVSHYWGLKTRGRAQVATDFARASL